MAQTQKWKGWISIHPETGGELGDSIARSPVYEFEIAGGPNDVGLAENELRRLWANAGSPVSSAIPSGATFRSYPNLEVVGSS
jgi:hypothetical protein